MVRLKAAQWTFVAEALRDIANVAAGAMVFGHFVADRPFDIRTAVIGVVLWIVLISSAVLIKAEGTQ